MDVSKFSSSIKVHKAHKVETDQFTIEKQVMKSQDFFIPLDAITSVEINRARMSSPRTGVICLIIGIILLLVPIIAFKSIGSVLLTLSIIYLIFWIIHFLKRQYLLIIRLNNGMALTYENKSEAFLNDLMIDMRTCFENKNQKLEVNYNERDITLIDQSTGKTINSNNYSNGPMINSGSRNENISNENNAKVTEEILTDSDMEVLERLFAYKTRITEPTDKNFGYYTKMQDYCKRKKKSDVTRILKKGGASAAKIILSGVGEALAKAAVPIFQKIITG